MKKAVLKLGTRKSLLAWAQSSWVARQVEKNNPGLRVELEGIETKGDQILDISLRNVEGKEFFVAEIDSALISGKVDFTVHSMKDLSLERPALLRCAATPVRENSRDVVLFSPHAVERLSEGRVLKIGTSSPRRIENIPPFLKKALPQVFPSPSREPQLEFIEIRGNVNTRLKRVTEPVDSSKYLDGVVLAFAGLIRLWRDPSGQSELKELLRGVRWMVLPLRECPTAPGQGALAVECRAEDTEVRQALSQLHHLATFTKVARERQVLENWGGGCHQRFGASAIEAPDGKALFFVRGVKPDGAFVDQVEWTHDSWVDPQAMELAAKEREALQIWDGVAQRKGSPIHALETLFGSLQGKGVFIAHSRAFFEKDRSKLQGARVWTSGSASWFRLAQQGIWVEGCAEGLGFEFLRGTLSEPVLELPSLSDWSILTHEGASSEWNQLGMQVIPTYSQKTQYSSESVSALKAATHVFWSSASQFDELQRWVSPRVVHACGLGKTAVRLREQGIQPRCFPSVEEWKKWLQIK